MPTRFPYFLADGPEELQELRRSRGWFLALGVALAALGLLAIGYPVVATLVTVELIGFVLVVAGGFELASSFRARRLGSFLLRVLCGLLYLFLGVVMIDRPALGAAGYTLVLALFFVAAGVLRVVLALTQRFSGWGWVLAVGVVNLVLGVLIWRELPAAALWVIGTFVGIDLVFIGASWVMLGMAARSIPAPAAPPAADLAVAARA
jgi:uncharacterized membrane protein HdeD (DUF308 family)